SDDDGVGLLDPGLAEDVDVHPVPDDEAARPVLAEPGQRLLVLVDRGHVPADLRQLLRNRRADTPASNDDRLHLGLTLTHARASSRTPCGYAITIPSHGAFRRT